MPISRRSYELHAENFKKHKARSAFCGIGGINGKLGDASRPARGAVAVKGGLPSQTRRVPASEKGNREDQRAVCGGRGLRRACNMSWQRGEKRLSCWLPSRKRLPFGSNANMATDDNGLLLQTGEFRRCEAPQFCFAKMSCCGKEIILLFRVLSDVRAFLGRQTRFAMLGQPCGWMGVTCRPVAWHAREQHGRSTWRRISICRSSVSCSPPS